MSDCFSVSLPLFQYCWPSAELHEHFAVSWAIHHVLSVACIVQGLQYQASSLAVCLDSHDTLAEEQDAARRMRTDLCAYLSQNPLAVSSSCHMALLLFLPHGYQRGNSLQL